jgi:hypothetical protein
MNLNKKQDEPDIVDFWESSAKWQADASDIGAAFNFHFPSMIKREGEIWAYYIAPSPCGGDGAFAVGKAISTDGVTWKNPKTVLAPFNCETMTFYTRAPVPTDLFHIVNAFKHLTGQRDELTPGVSNTDDQAWSANVTEHDPGWLTYGPNYEGFPPGQMHATFRLKIDNNSADDEVVVEVDIYDLTDNKTLNNQIISRRDFESTSDYSEFHLDFTVPDWNHSIEFRTYWHDKAYIKQDAVMVKSGYQNERYWGADNFSSFAGAFWDQQSGITYLAYEGGMGIGLAWSRDGEKFFRVVTPSHTGEIVDATMPYENRGLGTPTIFHKKDETWYLLYHVYDPQSEPNDMYMCVATGSSLFSLTEKQQVLFTHGYPNTSEAWDAGTVGKRSSLIQGKDDYYYLAYEGSTEQQVEGGFGKADWSTGLARSKDLKNWEKYDKNPILPQVKGTFGNDGPELIVIDGITFLYVRISQNGANRTNRYRLIWD